MTPEELEQALESNRQDRVHLGFRIEATRPDRYGSVFVQKYHNDSPYHFSDVIRPYTVIRMEGNNLTLDRENAIGNLRDARMTSMDDLLSEMEGHTIDEQSFATLEEVDFFLKQMGKSLSDIQRMPW